MLQRASKSRFSDEKDAFLLHKFGVENLKKIRYFQRPKQHPDDTSTSQFPCSDDDYDGEYLGVALVLHFYILVQIPGP